jgi:putative transposase
MARLARVVVPGMPHHVIQRGNRRQDVFFYDEDRVAYLSLLQRACQRYGVTVWAYCLMRNHVHVIAVPEREDSLARGFSDAHVRYTRRVNFREAWRGHLWQGRFGSSVLLDDRYLLAAVRYVERNPVRAGIVQRAWEYRWSSARWHVGLAAVDPLVSGDEPLRAMIQDWKDYLVTEDDTLGLATIRRETPVSRPIGGDALVRALESRLQRPLMRRKPGPRGQERSVAVPD